jgi:hypothetical protein
MYVDTTSQPLWWFILLMYCGVFQMMTPLLSVIRRGNIEMVWLLTQHKADITASDINVSTHRHGFMFLRFPNDTCC